MGHHSRVDAARYLSEEAVEVMQPELAKALIAGVTVLVDGGLTEHERKCLRAAARAGAATGATIGCHVRSGIVACDAPSTTSAHRRSLLGWEGQ